MKSAILSALLFAAYISTALADLVYDNDYEPPTYTNGQQIVGAGNISDGINGFTSQGLLIHDGGGINYLAPSTFTTGIHLISWDFTIPAVQGSSLILNAQVEAFADPVLFDMTIAGDGSGLRVEYGSGFPQRPSLSINAGQSYSASILLNLDADYYNFWLGATLLEDTVSIPSGAGIDLVDFGQNQALGLQAGIDNFRWEVVPEPTSLLLILCGGSALYFARRRNRRG